jgi:hypothetical protein
VTEFAQYPSPLFGVQSFDEKAPVEMIRLVLQAASHQARPFDLDGRAISVHAPDDRSGPARRGRPDPGNRKAALLLFLEFTFAADELWIDDVPLLVIDPVGEHPQLDADLRSRHTGPTGKRTGLPEIFDESVTGRHT